MPIFISHTTKDDVLAQKVYARLSRVHGIPCYIDDIDKELGARRGTASLTPVLIDRLRRCDTLLAVVTANTKGSWWVPFEIGTAREMPRAISSFTQLPDKGTAPLAEALPEFLLEWPRLRTEADIDTFARVYKAKQILLESGQIKLGGARASGSDVRTFETAIMTELGQRSP